MYLAVVQYNTALSNGRTAVPFEDLDGAILFQARVRGPAADTSGAFMFDTGAGYLALDHRVATRLGITTGQQPTAIAFTRIDVDSLILGDQCVLAPAPALDIDAEVVRRATGRAVVGLVGEQPFDRRVVEIDYRRHLLAISDSAASAPEPDAGVHVIPFDLLGDGKIVVRARVAGDSHRASPGLDVIVDTGATKSAWFRPVLDRAFPAWRRWPALRGLSAPTLVGSPTASIVRVPHLILDTHDGPLDLAAMDAAVMTSALQSMLSRVTGRPIAGVLGYTFLRNYRVTIDYPRRRLLLDPSGGIAGRPYEYSQVGLQLERAGDHIEAAGVVPGSPAARAGVRAGDVLTAVDRRPYRPDELLYATRALEGPPGTSVWVELMRAARPRTLRLARRRLL